MAHRTDELREAAEREAAGAGGELQEAQALVVLQFGHQAPEPLHLFAVLRVAPVDRVPPPVLHVDRHRLHPRQQHLCAAIETLRVPCLRDAQQTNRVGVARISLHSYTVYSYTSSSRSSNARSHSSGTTALKPSTSAANCSSTSRDARHSTT